MIITAAFPKPRKRQKESSDATEHARNPIDPAGPSAVLYLERYDTRDRPTPGHRSRNLCEVATEHICIGSCAIHWSDAAQVELNILSQLDQEIQDRIRLPVSADTLFESDARPEKKRSPSGYVEAIAHCVAAFQRATDATEHSQCVEIASKICAHANGLARRCHLQNSSDRRQFMEVIHRYIHNRTCDLAVKSVVNGAFEEHHRFWSRLRASEDHHRDGCQRNECLTILEICNKTLMHEGQALREEMKKDRA